MGTFTVIGIDDEEWTSWSQVVEATDEYDAMRRAAIIERLSSEHDEQIVVVGAIRGKHKLLTPSDENDRLVCSDDLSG